MSIVIPEYNSVVSVYLLSCNQYWQCLCVSQWPGIQRFVELVCQLEWSSLRQNRWAGHPTCGMPSCRAVGAKCLLVSAVHLGVRLSWWATANLMKLVQKYQYPRALQVATWSLCGLSDSRQIMLVLSGSFSRLSYTCDLPSCFMKQRVGSLEICLLPGNLCRHRLSHWGIQLLPSA